MAVFVHGCFWHMHDCREGLRKPKSNVDYWTAKLNRNRDRDAEHLIELKRRGWTVLVLWECEVGDLTKLAEKLRKFLSNE